jgi:hypothetical protein
LPGWSILVFGWLAPFTLAPQFAWYATPAFAAAVILVLDRQLAMARTVARVSFYLASNTFLWFFLPVTGDEGGVSSMFLKYPHIGFVLWYGAILVVYELTDRLNKTLPNKSFDADTRQAPRVPRSSSPGAGQLRR